MTPTPLTAAQHQALETFLSTFNDAFLCQDIGPALTCAEAEAFADLLKAFDHADAAKALLDGHCMEDEEGSDIPEHLERQAMLILETT